MPKVLPAVFSYEDMKRRFAQDNPDDPYTRRADLESGIYELDSWIIRVDDNNKAISTVGWKEHPSHTVVGGMYATEYGESLGGNSKALQDAREPQLSQSKPLVASFKHRRGNNARWIANAKKNGWSFPDSENWEQMSSLLPEDVLNAWLSKYPETMAIRSIRGEGEMAKCVYLDDPTPQWFNLMKSNYKRQLGESGFNVIRTSDGKRMNTKGLSRSQAKSMIDDLNSGKDISRYQKKKKSITGGWKGELKKFYPTSDFEPLGQYKDKDGDEVTHPAQAFTVGDVLFVFSPHYLKRHQEKRIPQLPITQAQINDFIAKGKTRFWAYISDEETNFDYVIGQLISGNTKINRQNKRPFRVKEFLEAINRATGSQLNRMCNLHHVSGGRTSGGYPTDAGKQLPIVYENTETKHGQKPAHRIKRDGRNEEPFNPFNMGGRR